MENRVASDNIDTLYAGQIFVFGSNLAGKHGAGAAKLAYDRFGAVWGQGVGLQGQSYGVPTKYANVWQTLPIGNIAPFVNDLIKFAAENPDKTFLVTQIGCGLAGYECKDIAPLFESAKEVHNIHLPAEFWKYL